MDPETLQRSVLSLNRNHHNDVIRPGPRRSRTDAKITKKNFECSSCARSWLRALRGCLSILLRRYAPPARLSSNQNAICTSICQERGHKLVGARPSLLLRTVHHGVWARYPGRALTVTLRFLTRTSRRCHPSFATPRGV